MRIRVTDLHPDDLPTKPYWKRAVDWGEYVVTTARDVTAGGVEFIDWYVAPSGGGFGVYGFYGPEEPQYYSYAGGTFKSCGPMCAVQGNHVVYGDLLIAYFVRSVAIAKGIIFDDGECDRHGAGDLTKI